LEQEGASPAVAEESRVPSLPELAAELEGLVFAVAKAALNADGNTPKVSKAARETVLVLQFWSLS
jgi:hypothetical protein